MAVVPVSRFPSLTPETYVQGQHYTMARNLEHHLADTENSVEATRAKLQNSPLERYIGRLVSYVV